MRNAFYFINILLFYLNLHQTRFVFLLLLIAKISWERKAYGRDPENFVNISFSKDKNIKEHLFLFRPKHQVNIIIKEIVEIHRERPEQHCAILVWCFREWRYRDRYSMVWLTDINTHYLLTGSGRQSTAVHSCSDGISRTLVLNKSNKPTFHRIIVA